MSAASAARSGTRASCSTSAGTGSFPSRRRSSSCGMKSCPTISSRDRASRASTTTASISPTRYEPWKRSPISVRLRARLHPVLSPCALVSDRETAHVSRMGSQRVRRAPLPDLLQDLHREGVGHVLRRDIRRLGRAAHQGPRPRGRHARRRSAVSRLAATDKQRGRQESHRAVRVPAPRPRNDVGGGGV